MSLITVLDDYQSVALTSADWSEVQAAHTVEVITDHIADQAELVRRLADSDIVVAMRERTPFRADVLEALPALRLLVTTGMANASIDLAAAARQGVTVCGTGSSGNAMPELTIGMMIALTRNFAQEDAAVRAGGWQHTIGPGLAGSTLGIVGLGRLGVPVANLAHAFGMDVVAWSPNLTQERADPPASRGQQARAVRDSRCDHHPHAAVGRQPRPDRRRRPGPDEAIGVSDQRLARPDRR